MRLDRTLRIGAACLALTTAPLAAEESLRFFPPPGYSGVHVSDSGALRLTEYVPEGASLEFWQDAVTIAVLPGSDLSAEAFVQQVTEDMVQACPVNAFQMDPDVQPGPTGVRTLSIHACQNLNPTGRSEVSVLRVIEGRTGLFAIQKSWLDAPPREELDAWSERLAAIALCDADGCS